MEVLIAATPEEAAQFAAEAVLEGLQTRTEGHNVLGVATGSTPLGLYGELAKAVKNGEADFSNTIAFALDEYVGLESTHKQSYRQTLIQELCKVIGLPEANLNTPNGFGDSEEQIRKQAAAYDAAIVAAGVDVQILGIGTNGHIGFNEPGSSLRSRSRIKRLSNKTREDNARFFDGIDQVPTHSVTQGLGTILEARRVVLIATGSNKAEAIATALEGPLSSACPGSAVQLHPDAVIVLDEAAAAGLKNRLYYDDSAAGLQFGI
ncbi:glucosamine-6-phosphate deaminase [Paeniglutamicibacter gangotriensis]|uniref:N-acetylglucosamine-6-phosphate isomerase n=2 Tax=Paeniglutamicibacter gangotriensis TaxID=254787 RepID=M7MWL8_9MICC|nr:glucosamine-6-phosphate deaminase [Paeniglutamicibacter gangotriensis]EMQ99335.1 N-acetylglucosamine-6-phosphate isomerase [Paeniglutamicibacter gangotriensis Lz1y]KAA0977585.1 glucosamine-6-phosphate deaminase [Paeniglutamicibacter gangotriensis]